MISGGQLVGYFALLLFQNATYFLGNALYIRQHYRAIEAVLGGLFGQRPLAVSNKRHGIVVISQNGFDSLRFFSSSFIRGRNVVCSFQQSVDHRSFVAQRVTGKEIEITVGVCWFTVNIHMNFCAASTCYGV